MPTKPKSSANEIYQIKVTLLGTDIWRRLLVPSDLTLARLHDVLQIAMGWEDDHLHAFRAGQQVYGPPSRQGYAFNIDDRIDEGEVQLHQLLARVGSKIVYTYDFGDGWEHGIVIEKRLPVDQDMTYPVCTGGENAGPPEDIGGVGGYYDLVEAIQDPQHERHEEFLEWVGEEWDPGVFPIEKVNGTLQRIRRRAAGSQ